MRVTSMEIVNSDEWDFKVRSGVETPPFTDFYEHEYRSVVGLAYALTGSRSAAEELAQDGFIAAYRRWADIGGYERPEAWVRRVVVNSSRSWGRRKGAEVRALTRLRGRREPLDELPQPDHEFWSAVRALPRRQAQAVALHYLEDRPVEEIAEILECSPGTVKTHLHRARNALADTLGLNSELTADLDTETTTDTAADPGTNATTDPAANAKERR